MKTFLFEQYGYYTDLIDGKFFNIDGWNFKLIKTDLTETKIKEIDEYLIDIRNIFKNSGVYIVKTRLGNFFSYYDNEKYVLICVKEAKVNVVELNTMHKFFTDNNKKINLNELLKTWGNRIEFIESNALSALRLDGVYYKGNFEISMFVLGLAQNSLQYLSECIENYGVELENLTLTHKRLIRLNSLDFFDPFNFVIDHPIRDWCELYKNDYLNFPDFCEILKYYKIDSKLATLIICRIMYHTGVLDLLEDNIEKKDVNFKLNYVIEKEFAKLKKIYSYFREIYLIRPIDWLE